MGRGLLEANAKNHIIPNAITDLSGALPAAAYSVHMQPVRNVVVTVQVLSENGSVLDTITGRTTGGSISVDSASMTRRSGSLKMEVERDLMPSHDGVIWFNRLIRVYQGIVDMSAFPREPINFLLGTFIIEECSLSVGSGTGEIDIKLADKMSLYDKDSLDNELKLSEGIPIHEAIRKLMELVGETEFGEIHESKEGEVIPYEYTKPAGTEIESILKDLRDMYMDYICGYNVRGEFEFKKVEIQKEVDVKEPKWRFDSTNDDRADLTLSFKEDYKLKDVKNRILVFGAADKSGYAPSGEVRITDSKSPFNIDAIGVRSKVIIDSKLSNDIQCVTKARYEVWKTAHFQEKCSISSVPIYLLDGNDIIEVTNPTTGLSYRYMIDSFSIDLGIEGDMNITAHKLYYVGLEYGESEIPLVEAIKKGINQLGWLSLGEERIKDCYGLSGSGENEIVVRFTSTDVGGEQASVTGYTSTKVQTVMIDLKDFEKLDFKDENGSTEGRSKGDYVDRVLGHEMFHAVCNDYYGVDKTIEMPIWFKEGFAELLIGGKDRYQSINGYDTVESKKEAMLLKARSQLNGVWEGTSEDYAAAYLIAAAIYYMNDEASFKKMFVRLSSEKNVNMNFLLKLMPIAASNDEVKEKVLESMKNMPIWKNLESMEDSDVCSIGGSNMMNIFNSPLNAENIFNNQMAKTPINSFKLRYD